MLTDVRWASRGRAPTKFSPQCQGPGGAALAPPQFFLPGDPRYGGDSGMSGPHTPAHVSPHFPRHPKDSIGRIPLSHNFRASAFWLCKITASRLPSNSFTSLLVLHPTSAQVLICIFISMQSQPLAELLNGSSFDFTPGWPPRRRRGVGMGASRLSAARPRTHSKSGNLKVRVRGCPRQERPHHFLAALWPER